MIGVRGRTGGDHAHEVARLNRIDRRAAHAGAAVLSQAARTHAAHLAAHALGADVARRHRLGPRECRADAQCFRADEHLLRGRISRKLLWGFLFFSHVVSSLFIHLL